MHFRYNQVFRKENYSKGLAMQQRHSMYCFGRSAPKLSHFSCLPLQQTGLGHKPNTDSNIHAHFWVPDVTEEFT
jgi:hypothetical protein